MNINPNLYLRQRYIYLLVAIILILSASAVGFLDWEIQKFKKAEKVLNQFHGTTIFLSTRIKEELFLLEGEFNQFKQTGKFKNRQTAYILKLEPHFHSINNSLQSIFELHRVFKNPEFESIIKRLQIQFNEFQAIANNENLDKEIFYKSVKNKSSSFLIPLTQLLLLHLAKQKDLMVKFSAKRSGHTRNTFIILAVILVFGGIIVVKIFGEIKRILLEKEKQTESLKEAEKALRVAHSELEIRVEERTGELQEARKAAETSNLAKGNFLANMSHEIRTPMNAILGYAQILRRDKSLSVEQRQWIETIENSGNHLLELINDILDISKIEAGHMELQVDDFDLHDLLNGLSVMFQLRCQEKILNWNVHGVSKEPLLVNGDQGKLRQILINMLGNAVKFTEEGSVTLNLVTEGQDRYRFEVIDTGKGIPREAQKEIFEPFRQDDEGIKKGGTGLGLAIAKRQVDLMDSEMGLESQPGKGSRFHFSVHLPPAEGEVATRGERGREVVRLADGYRVKALVVDDIKDNREVLSMVLKSIGVEVTLAENGREAVEKTVELVPDIVFMDLRMPVMNGQEAMRQILEKFGKDRVKISILTASVLRHDREKFIQMGGHDFILKPFRAEAVFACLKKLLNVEFVYADAPTVPAEETPLPKTDFSKLQISGEIISQLKEAAEFGDIEKSEETLCELERSGEDGKTLAAHLKVHVGKYHLERVLEIIEEVNPEL